MKQLFRLCLLLAVVSVAWGKNNATGTLTVFVFKNQTPLLGSVVTVMGTEYIKVTLMVQ